LELIRLTPKDGKAPIIYGDTILSVVVSGGKIINYLPVTVGTSVAGNTGVTDVPFRNQNVNPNKSYKIT